MAAPGRPDYRHGRIIGAYLTSSVTGKREQHPAVILSPNWAITQPARFDPRTGGENQIVVAGVSTKYANYAMPHIRLPYDSTRREGHASTRLTRDSAVIIGWFHIISIDDDRTYWGGDVPAPLMGRINAAVRGHLQKAFAKDIRLVEQLRRMLEP
jgi:hypothetical protein